MSDPEGKVHIWVREHNIEWAAAVVGITAAEVRAVYDKATEAGIVCVMTTDKSFEQVNALTKEWCTCP